MNRAALYDLLEELVEYLFNRGDAESVELRDRCSDLLDLLDSGEPLSSEDWDD
jgi:hypothetical protein